MILIDNRSGSKNLHPLIPGSLLCYLEYGDAMLEGNGASGPVTVGVELKTIHDVVSCIVNGRFAGHQLPGMVRTYDYSWLLVYGIWRAEPVTGVLQTLRGRGWREVEVGGRGFMLRDLESWLLSIQVKGGVRVKTVATLSCAARWIVTLHGWWGKDWDDHHSIDALDSSGVPTLAGRASMVRRVAKELPGIGWKKSGAVERVFGSVAEMVDGGVDDWCKVEGVGRTLAGKAVEALHGGEYRKKSGVRDWE